MTPISLQPIQYAANASLEKVPNDVKKMIVNCLRVSDISSASCLNKPWQKIVNDNHVWLKVAKQMTKKEITPENAHDYCLYGHINRKFYKILSSSGVNERIIKELNSCNSELEKYNLLRDYLKKHKEPLEQYIFNISNKELTKDELFYAKQVICDFALSADISSETGQIPLVLCGIACETHANLELFNFTLGRLKKSSQHLDIFRTAMRYLSKHGPDSAYPFIEILLKAGARPDENDLIAALDDEREEDHLMLLLDFCNNSVFDKTLSKLKEKLDVKLKSAQTDRREAVAAYNRKCALISSALLPTFGGVGKDPIDTCCVIL